MKTFNQIFSLALVAVLMTACGSSNPVAQPATQPSGYYQNGQWVQTGAAGNNVAPGGCVPLQSQLSFVANGARVDSVNILAGSFPAQTGLGSYGQVVMGGNPTYNGAPGSIQYQPKQGESGQINLFGGNAGSISGTISLNPYKINEIQNSMGQTSYQNGTYPAQQQRQLCVNSIALWAVPNSTISSGSQYSPQIASIYQAMVFLYLNNGQVAGPYRF